MTGRAALRLAQRLGRARDGVTIVEFAMLAPVLLMTIFGLFDMGFNIYAETVLQGAVQQAARASTVEGAAGNLHAIDSIVTASVQKVIPSATLAFKREAYSNFSDVGMAEDYTDTNGDGTCDNGEPYEDANNNGSWDSDRGTAGLGGARDAVLYTVSMSYPRLFPLATMIGLPPDVTMQSQTVLRNQPYRLQATNVQIRNCL